MEAVPHAGGTETETHTSIAVVPKNRGGKRCRDKNENEPEIRELMFKDNGPVCPMT